MYQVRTDLALEAREKFEEDHVEIKGVRLDEEQATPDIHISSVIIETENGAKAMGWKDCETLAPGSKADLIMIDLNQPNMQPLNHIAKNLVYSGSKQNVKMTMVAGKILYEDGKFNIGTDAEEIYAQANERIERMKRQ